MFSKNFVFALILASNIICQPIKIYLNTLTKLDEDDVHLVTLSDQPKEKLVLPTSPKIEVSLTKKYFDLFYSWDTEKDEKISVLVYQYKNEDLLFVDKNNDNDLTNDGKPIIFPMNKDSVTIDITSEKDRNKKVKLALFRKPDLADSLKYSFIDKKGNLSSSFLNFAKIYSEDFNFEGKKRSFYFDYRITLRSGKLNLGASPYSVGLFDFTNNGSFNDDRDLLIIDLNKTGKLSIIDNPANVFAIDDVFAVDGRNYKLTEVDKYGKYFVIEETKEEPTFHYLKWIQDESSKGQKKGNLTDEFWSYKFVSLSGEEIDITPYKGKYIFLNFWGEWCQPCKNEIDELKLSYEKYSNKVVFLGVMKVNDLTKAKKLIHEKNISWQNIFITKEIITQFNIIGYPTNILIYPDGINYIKGSLINRSFFETTVK